MPDPGQAHSHDSRDNPAWNEYLTEAARGNPEALAALYDETSGLVYRVARRILCNSADAEEITLDVYVYVWRSAASYEPSRSSITAWLTMLARSRAIDRLRNSKSARRSCSFDSATAHRRAYPSTIAESDQQILVQCALQQLSPEQQHLLELSFFSGLSHQELSSRLNIPLGTIKTRIRTSLARLGVLLGELKK